MNPSYDLKGVTITPLDGGFYMLSHPSIAEPIKVRGKDKAEQRAEDLVAGIAAEDDDMKLEQPDLDALTAAAGVAQSAPPSPEAAETSELDRLRARVAELEARPVTTVASSGGEVPGGLPPGVPNLYTGVLADDVRETLENNGVKMSRIILEENSDIPPTGLFLGHNGRSYMISPGEPVDVPDFLLGILDDAVMSAPILDGKTQKVLAYRSRSKYPYRRV